jgi:DNA helicase-2/ATP-dependent DNA helicase PcrA
MGTPEFKAAWECLSSIQKEVAEWEEGPLLVLAGPGSGKTRVLTCRIARILDSSSQKNFRILGLTFTNKAADEMRSRVIQFTPGQDGRLFLGTFHSFCADVLRQHGTHLRINPNFQIYSQEGDLQAVLDDAVNKAKKVSRIVSDLDKKTLPVILRLKSYLVSPEKCREVFKDESLAERMAVVYPAYESELSNRNALDFNSLIFKAHELFTRFPAFAKRFRTVYPFICVDEFQDTNHAQYSLIRALTGDQHRNLFVVADDDQIIYQWNGASHKRIEQYLDDFSAKVLQLPTNYRCPPEVVSLANNLIRYNFLRTADKKPLQAIRPSTGKDIVRLLPPFADEDSEMSAVATDIKQHHRKELGAVVVLARNRRLLDAAARALQSVGLSAVISQRKDEFASTPLIWLHSLLRLANRKDDRKSLEAVCGAFNQLVRVEIDPNDVVAQAQGSDLGFLQHWVKMVHQLDSNSFAEEAANEVQRYLAEAKDYRAFSWFALDWAQRVSRARQDADGGQPSEVFAGFDEERMVWEELVAEITRSLGEHLTLEAFLQELQMHSKEPTPKPNTVVLMTIHGAKGKEFDHVYLVGLVEDELPSFQSKKKGDGSSEMEEERRNCFVAITRTIKTLTISHAETYRGWGKAPSRFLYEMGLLNE